MSAQQRLRGQECTLIIIRDGEVETELTDIASFNWSAVAESMATGFLGERTERTDDIYKHCKGDFELQLHSAAAWTNFRAAVKARQQRITPDVQFNIALVESYPNGDEQTITFSDVKFAEFPQSIGSRTDYVKVKIDFMCDDYSVA